MDTVRQQNSLFKKNETRIYSTNRLHLSTERFEASALSLRSALSYLMLSKATTTAITIRTPETTANQKGNRSWLLRRLKMTTGAKKRGAAWNVGAGRCERVQISRGHDHPDALFYFTSPRARPIETEGLLVLKRGTYLPDAQSRDLMGDLIEREWAPETISRSVQVWLSHRAALYHLEAPVYKRMNLCQHNPQWTCCHTKLKTNAQEHFSFWSHGNERGSHGMEKNDKHRGCYSHFMISVFYKYKYQVRAVFSLPFLTWKTVTYPLSFPLCWLIWDPIRQSNDSGLRFSNF